MSVKNLEHRTVFKDVSTSFVATAGASPAADPLIAGKAKYTIVVQRIDVNITTAAAESWTFQDSTGKVIAVVPASQPEGHYVALDSPEGIPLTEGADLDMAASDPGVAGSCTVTAYLKPTGTMVPSQI